MRTGSGRIHPTICAINRTATTVSKGNSYAIKLLKQKTIAQKDKPVDVLLFYGLYTQWYRFEEALAGIGKHRLKVSNALPTGAEYFPASYKELFGYDFIVLSNVNYKALGDIGVEILYYYVEQGGNLLVTGGPYAFGNGEFEGSRFLELLPVILSGPFDLKWSGKGASWPLRPAKESHSLLKGVSFEDNPRVFWNHWVKPKAETEVVLMSGDQPALVCGRYGKGKVAVLTLSPTGKEGKGETAWWNWQGWLPLVRNIFNWFTE